MKKIKKVLLLAMSLVMATGLFTGCFAGGTNNSGNGTSVETVDGKSAYQIWLDNGFSGTEEDFLEWLKGDKGQDGEDGEDGKSAYQIWLENGHSGTEEDFFDWLKGECDHPEDKESSTQAPESSTTAPESSTQTPDSSTQTPDSSVVEAEKFVFTVVTDKFAMDGTTSTEVEAGAVLVLPAAPEAEGKTFTGWVDIEGNKVEEGATMPEEDYAIFATWEINAYTLTIKQDGEDDVVLKFGVAAVPATETEAEIIDINALDFVLGNMYVGTTEIAYEFEGKPEEWTLADTTITAVKTVAKYSFTVVTDKFAEDGSTTTEVAYGSEVELPAAPTAEGKTFTGWVDLEGNAVTENFTMPAESVAIFAAWEINAYTLTIKQDGADDVTLKFGVEAVPATETTEEIIDVNALNFVLESFLPEATETVEYVFEGKPEEWALEDTTISIIETARKYFLTIQDGNPMNPSAYYEEKQVGYGEAIELPAREDTVGKTFIGWFYSDLETGEEFAAPATMPAMHIRIYAKWELETKTLTVNKADGSVWTYSIAVEEGGDWMNPIIGLDNLDRILEIDMSEPRSEFYTVSYEGIPETWELQDYTINEVEKSSIFYLDRLNKTWEAKPNNADNYWDGAENVVTVEHLANAITKVGFDATAFTIEQLEKADAAWADWVRDRQMWVTYAVPVDGINAHKFTINFDIKFENMSSTLSIFAAKDYTGDAAYDFEIGLETFFSAARSAEDLGDGWYRFSVEIDAEDTVGNAADYIVISLNNTAEADKTLPSYAYITNFELLCIHEYATACDPTCELCGEMRYDNAEHTNVDPEWISNGWGGHYQICNDCGSQVNASGCETVYTYDDATHKATCELCGYVGDEGDHWLEEGYNDDGHYAEGCYCGYVTSELIPHTKVDAYNDWNHYQTCEDCYWESDYIPHTYEYEVTDNGHTLLGCADCEYAPEEVVEVPHSFGEWTLREGADWLYDRTCECGYTQTLKNRLDSPVQYFLTEEGTLDLTGLFTKNVDPAKMQVKAATSTYSYWNFAAGVDGGSTTQDFYTGETAVTVNEDGTVTYALDKAKVAAAPYYFGWKQIMVTVDYDGFEMVVPVTTTAVTKAIRTVADLKWLGVGGRADAANNSYLGNSAIHDSYTKGNDVIGYFLLMNDIDCNDAFIAAGYSGQQSYFKNSTFDGNGHTVSNFQVGAGGIFGGMYASNVINANFTDVFFNGNESASGYWGNYTALFAHFANGNCTFENINVEFTKMELRRDNYQFEDGLLVSGLKGATFKNIVIDASDLDVECALGYDTAKATATYENVVLYAKSVKVISYKESGGKNDGTGTFIEQEKDTQWPMGVTFVVSTTAATVEDEFNPHCSDGTVTLKSDAFVVDELYSIGEALYICEVAGELNVTLDLPLGGTYKVVVLHEGTDGAYTRIVFTNVVFGHKTAVEPGCGEDYVCDICNEVYAAGQEHNATWKSEDGKDVYSCPCGAIHEELVTRLAQRQRLVADWSVDGSGNATTTKTNAIDLSALGEYKSASITFDGVAYDPANLEAGAIPLSVYGERDLVVTVVTEDGAEHSVIVPVLVVTAIFDTAAELNTMYTLANAAEVATNVQGGYFELGANITYNAVWSGWVSWQGVGYSSPEAAGFKGVFDGCGYTIDGLEIAYGSWGGFISVISATGIVRNVGFTNAKITGMGSFLCTIGNGLVENVYIKYAAGEKTNGSHGYNAAFMCLDNPKGMTTYMTVRDCFIDGTDVTASSAWGWIAMNANGTEYATINLEGVYAKQSVWCSLTNGKVTILDGSAYGHFSASDEAQKAEIASWNSAYWTVGEDGVPVFNSAL